MGLLDPITDLVFGDPPKASRSGAFPKAQLKALGTSYGDFLLDRLGTPVQDTEQFRLGSTAIRDALSMQSATARQRLGDAAITGGFADSGAVLAGMTDIERAQAQSYAQSVTELLLALEDRREQNVLPYLSEGAGESQGLQGLNITSELSRDNLQFGLLDMLLGSSGGSSGNPFGN
jgi:hypothetical protein